MAHSHTKNWLHIIFSTKERHPLINKEVEPKIYNILYEETKEMKCYLNRINGVADHVHLLVLLHASKSLAEFVKHIKGVSSHQVNQTDWLEEKFSWQTGYSAFSVSESQLEKVRRYIDRQKIHHEQQTFEMELEQLLKLHDLL